MPRDSNGNASLDPVYRATSGTLIRAIQHNTPLADITSMLTGSLARNGSGGMLADLNMNGFDIQDIGTITGYPSSAEIEASYLNYVTPQTLTSGQKAALAASIGFIPKFSSGDALPSSDIGPIWHALYGGIMTWQVFSANSASYTGYASIDIGQPFYDAQPTARPGCLKSNGAAISKTTYAPLWNWARHNGLTISIGSWVAGTGYYADVGDGTFRIPDERGEFWRNWDDGRGLNAGRAIASFEDSLVGAHTHPLAAPLPVYTPGRTLANGSFAVSDISSGISDTSANVGAETRPRSIARLVSLHF